MIYTCSININGKRLTQTYEGFRKVAYSPSERPHPEAKFLAMVWEPFNGDFSCWWLENEGIAQDELRRLYRSDYQTEIVIDLYPVVQELP